MKVVSDIYTVLLAQQFVGFVLLLCVCICVRACMRVCVRAHVLVCLSACLCGQLALSREL